MKLLLVALLLAVVTAGCGAAASDPAGDLMAASAETSEQVSLTRQVVAEAGDAARMYGRDHLGHYLHLKDRHLRMYGASIPTGFGLEISSTHTSYCIQVTNRALPSIHRWHTATIDSQDREASSADNCRR